MNTYNRNLSPSTSDVVEGIMQLIKQNIIAKTNVITDILTGATIIEVENSFHFTYNQEIVLIDYGYNDSSSPHYQIYEYARIKEVIDTTHVRLYAPVVSNWLVSNNSFIQKTIGHSPLYEDRVYYGDREVIPSEDMAITVEPVSLSNEWIYLMGGLSREYKMTVTVYGKDIKTEDGMIILNKYSDAIYQLLMSDLHPDINNYDTPVLYDVPAGGSQVIVKDSVENRDKFRVSGTEPYMFRTHYDIQDNLNIELGRVITGITYSGGEMTISLSRPLQYGYSTSQFASFTRHGMYFYDSRTDSIVYGKIQKGSAMLRAGEISWWGKMVEEHRFPQQSQGVDYFPEVEDSSDSSDSSSEIS